MGKREWDTIFLAEFMENDNTLLSWGLIGGAGIVRGWVVLQGIEKQTLSSSYSHLTTI